MEISPFDMGIALFKAFDDEGIEISRSIGSLRADESACVLTRAIKILKARRRSKRC